MDDRVDLTYRQHRIIAGKSRGRPVAIVYEGRKKLEEFGGESVQAAVADAKAWVEQQLERERVNRRAPHIGTRAEYTRALRMLEIGLHHMRMLHAHAAAPGRALSAGKLARAAGYENFEVANAHYGKLGRMVAEFLELTPPTNPQRDAPTWTMALAEYVGGRDQAGHGQWVMHEELFEALRELGMVEVTERLSARCVLTTQPKAPWP